MHVGMVQCLRRCDFELKRLLSPAFVLALTVAVDLQFEREDEGKLQEITQ